MRRLIDLLSHKKGGWSGVKMDFIDCRALIRGRGDNWLVFVLALLCCGSGAVNGQPYIGMTIDGVYQPSDVGTEPVTADHSWLWLEFAGGARFTWYFGPGTDGGAVFAKAQGHPPYDDGSGGGTVFHDPGELTGEFLFLNEPAVLFTVEDGITMNEDLGISMRNLRVFRGTVESDIGSGLAGNAMVPEVSDITGLTEGENGWQLYADGRYDLVIYTNWLGQQAAIHFAGRMVANPAPRITGVWPSSGVEGDVIFMFGSGFAGAETVQLAIDGTPVPLVQVVTDDLLLFVLPAGVVSGPITVTSEHGQAASPTAFGVPVASPVITGVWPGEGARVGDVVFVFGKGFAAPASVSVGDGQTGTVQVVSDEMLIFLMPESATRGALLVHSPGAEIAGPEVYRVWR
jgi:hypothetical protein